MEIFCAVVAGLLFFILFCFWLLFVDYNDALDEVAELRKELDSVPKARRRR